MLMYRGSSESWPCRTDLLCFLKREYQLIGTRDLEAIREFMVGGMEEESVVKKAFKRKSLF